MNNFELKFLSGKLQLKNVLFLLGDAEFFDVSSGVLVFLGLIVFSSKDTKHQENTLGERNRTFGCQFSQRTYQ